MIPKDNPKPNFGVAYASEERVGEVTDGPASTPSFTQRFDAELADITTRRGVDYGHPALDFARASAIQTIVGECPDPRLRHVLYMMATKMARLTHTPGHFDSWLDIAGYARTAMMVLDTAKENPSNDY